MPRPKKPANGASDSPVVARARKKGNGAIDYLNDPEAIARRAYEIYERRGGRDGADLDDWLEAERELGPGPSDVTGPAPAKAQRRKVSEGTGL
jgi:hypothetical protein